MSSVLKKADKLNLSPSLSPKQYSKIACQISQWADNSDHQSHGFEI